MNEYKCPDCGERLWPQEDEQSAIYENAVLRQENERLRKALRWALPWAEDAVKRADKGAGHQEFKREAHDDLREARAALDGGKKSEPERPLIVNMKWMAGELVGTCDSVETVCGRQGFDWISAEQIQMIEEWLEDFGVTRCDGCEWKYRPEDDAPQEAAE